MNEDEARRYADDLLECQRLVIAKATLAGCRFEPQVRNEWIGRAKRRHEVTYYIATLPDGLCVGVDFRDMYEAACACVNVLDHTHVVDPTDGLFQLREDNEQPPKTPISTHVFYWTALQSLRKAST